MEYPYYVITDIEALPDASGEERQRIIRRIAALIGDPEALREILGMDPYTPADFYPDGMKPDLSTADAIDSFLDNFGDPKAAQSKEVKELDELVPLPPADYDLSSIESDPLITPEEMEGEPDATAAALDAFLPQQQAPLSESLARAMIKNGNYSKALEIITDLSLNNPKKSIYFADQIRFLKKLILNQSKQMKQ